MLLDGSDLRDWRVEPAQRRRRRTDPEIRDPLGH
jgi:hypothetical protein